MSKPLDLVQSKENKEQMNYHHLNKLLNTKNKLRTKLMLTYENTQSTFRDIKESVQRYKGK